MRVQAAALTLLPAIAAAYVGQTVCNGQTYTYNELAGFGYISGSSRDVFGDTIGGIGSAISVPRQSIVKLPNGDYEGLLYAQPDRGWNTQGTLNYQGRIHLFSFTFTPAPNATVANPSQNNLQFKYLTSTLYSDPQFVPTTGLDANPLGGKNVFGYPELPLATYTGNGYGGPGPGGNRVPVDHEGLVVFPGQAYWTSDEYAPYIYKYNLFGIMQEAIQPPAAFLPMRNGSLSFSADSPTLYSGESDDVYPTDPTTGRENNHGFEGLTISPDGKNLYALMQGALDQDGGTKKSTAMNARLVHYDISCNPANLVGEYVVQLPTYPSGAKPNTAYQSEIHYISPTQFLVLARDSKAGQCQSSTESVYRHADVFDISKATNIKGSTYDCATCAVAPGGKLATGVKPATYCSFLDFNVNAQLERFGVHNGGAADAGLLNEKWESLALFPVVGGEPNEYFLMSMSDDDFITQDGYLNFGQYKYSDNSGCNLNNQVLLFHITLPSGSAPYVS